jgi:hypothetical protein
MSVMSGGAQSDSASSVTHAVERERLATWMATGKGKS